MSKKSFIIILILSIVFWYTSRIMQALVGVFFFGDYLISLFPSSSKVETGYPLALMVSDSDNIRYGFYFINIVFWFVVIWLLKRKFFNSSKK